MSTYIESFALKILLINWTNKDDMKELRSEIIRQINAEFRNIMEVPVEIQQYCLPEQERRVKIARALISVINKFIEEDGG